MCGLNGALIFKNSSFTISESYIVNMRDTMVHRGPDGGGVWISGDGKIGLAHRRLSIIDLSENANQPMKNADGSIQLVFNGEIYNHAEIRSELEALGKYDWITDHSDTEVVIHAFEEWGIDCIHRFRGMFAIALWDARNNKLWLVRDRVGIKPLYYSVHNDRVVFASEIKALLEDPEQKKEVNENGLFHYLSFLTVPAPETLFEGIFKVPAGTWMKISTTGETVVKKYYDVLDNIKSLSHLSEDEIANRVLAELKVAVQYRKVSDVPVGVFLSGGIDSSTNAALFSEGDEEVVKTFSIGYDGKHDTYENELVYAKLVAKEVGAVYHELLLSMNDLVSFLPKMIELQDEPLADPVCVPIYYVSKLARENDVIVCQVGEGADELFFGYPGWARIFQIHKLNRLPIPLTLKKLLAKVMKIFGMDGSVYFEYLRRANAKEPVFWSGSEAYSHVQKMRLLSLRMKNKYKDYTSFEVIKPYWERFNKTNSSDDIINWMAYMDLNLRLPELLLMRVDKMSMGVSLEARVPFLDHNIIELAMSIPGKLKYKNNTLKYILKKAVRGIIPDSIIDRKKQGFAAPIGDWYEDALGDQVKQTLKVFCMQTDYLNWEEVKKLLESKNKARSWPLLNLALWWNHYIKN